MSNGRPHLHVSQLTYLKRRLVDDMTTGSFNGIGVSSFAQAESALVLAGMLTATVMYPKNAHVRLGAADVLELEARAFQTIQSALERPDHATSDQVIAAVALLAMYEKGLGNETRYRTHMMGLSSMIVIRGGLPSRLVGLIDILCQRIDAFDGGGAC